VIGVVALRGAIDLLVTHQCVQLVIHVSTPAGKKSGIDELVGISFVVIMLKINVFFFVMMMISILFNWTF